VSTPYRIQNYIGGIWQDAASGKTTEDFNPASGEVLALVPDSDQSDTDRAVAAAVLAYQTWRLTPAPKRGEIVARAGQILARRKEELARMMTREMGKVLEEARGDVQEGIDMAAYMSGEGRRSFGYTTTSELPDKFAMAVRDPIGVGAIITPWNFPMAIPTWKTFPALVAGNTLVFKPATDTPLLAMELVRALEEAGLPGGVLNFVCGSGSQVGERLIGHPQIQFISFTGSGDVGRRVATVGGDGLKRISLELGGKNAVIVMDDANLDLAVDGIIWSAYGTAGQRCTACSRVIVDRTVHRQLTDRLSARVAALTLGDGLDPAVQVGPVINRGARDRIHGYVQVGVQEGGQLIAGGQVAETGALAKGHFYQPTLFDQVTPDMRIAREEIFGPVLSVIEAHGLEDAVAKANGVAYGLSASIFSQDVNRVFRAIRDLATGIVYVNAGTTGAEIHLPFGGQKGTGNGHREAGTAAIDFFTEWKAVYVDYSGRLQRAQIDT
jgi:aldehyde dehydrogenase (NAD+)